ncbi:MAG: M48 family metallopeptidase [Actinomycetota bacterium]|nr:M48 family metallopeptidase [Actinomycetota bacterium]
MRGLVVVALLSLAAAGIVGFVSRAPAELRTARPNVPERIETAQADPDQPFRDVDVARHGAYRGPIYLSLALGFVVQIALLLALARGPFHDFVSRVAGNWFAGAALAGAGLGIALWLVALPLSYVRGFVMQHAWGLSTQNTLGWLSDQLKGAGISVVLSAGAAVIFIGIQRWQPRWWWLIGAAAFSVLSGLITFLFPVVIAPLFNRFEPVPEPLATRVEALAERAGVVIDDVLVADASRRTRAENAYVAGLGASRRVVLDDNLLQGTDEAQTMFVVAHELGHEAENHVLKFVGLSAVSLFLGFGVLALLSQWAPLWQMGGVEGPSDIGALPLVVLIALVLGTLTLPLTNHVSRNFEARADEIALDLTKDPDPAVGAFVRLAYSNIADLRPHPLAVALLYTHPPIAERIVTAMAVGQQAP